MINSIKIGDQRSYSRVISQEDTIKFGALTGDMNKAHFCETYTKNTVFKKPIVHGMLLGSLFSCIFGLDFPGEGTIYCSQTLKFLKPIYPDTELKIIVTVKEVLLEKIRVIFTTEIYNNQDQCCLTGEAVLMPRKENQDE